MTYVPNIDADEELIRLLNMWFGANGGRDGARATQELPDPELWARLEKALRAKRLSGFEVREYDFWAEYET